MIKSRKRKINRTVHFIFFIIFLVLFFSVSSFGDMNNYAENYFNKIEKKNTTVFYSQCSSKDKRYIAILIFELGKMKGLLVEKRDNIVINLATVVAQSKGLGVEETNGGVYTYDRVKKLINELAGYKFRFMTPFRIQDLNDTSCTCSTEG